MPTVQAASKLSLVRRFWTRSGRRWFQNLSTDTVTPSVVVVGAVTGVLSSLGVFANWETGLPILLATSSLAVLLIAFQRIQETSKAMSAIVGFWCSPGGSYRFRRRSLDIWAHARKAVSEFC